MRGADVVCLCTSASRRCVAPAWLARGHARHARSATRRRAASSTRRSRAPAACSWRRATRSRRRRPGCAELAGLDPDAAAELGEVVLGTRPGRVSDDELTVYKSMGTVVEDLAAAEVVIRRAEERGAGRRIPF